jgi:hypothetical protein
MPTEVARASALSKVLTAFTAAMHGEEVSRLRKRRGGPSPTLHPTRDERGRDDRLTARSARGESPLRRRSSIVPRRNAVPRPDPQGAADRPRDREAWRGSRGRRPRARVAPWRFAIGVAPPGSSTEARARARRAPRATRRRELVRGREREGPPGRHARGPYKPRSRM